jgi:methionyl-tRNA formyltransferase
MNILFAGTPDIAVPCLTALEQRHAVAVLTNPDAPSGRSSSLAPPPVKVRALELGLTVYQPAKLDAEARVVLGDRFDLLVSFAYGRIFGPKFLSLFPLGGVNVHPSLLPRWRGPSPLSAAILARDERTGISVQKLALEMDAGDILIRVERALDGTETTGSLTDWAATAAPALLLEAVELAAKDAPSVPQNESDATYCHLVTKDDGVIDWSRTAADIDARIRACDPWPGASTSWNGQRLTMKKSSAKDGTSASSPGTVLSVDKSNGILVQTGSGLLAVRELQLPGRKSLDFRSFLNGNPALIGSRLGESA